jgi:hypothetical protein
MIQLLSTNGHADKFDPVLKKNKENNESSKNAILLQDVLLCVLVAMKNNKL